MIGFDHLSYQALNHFMFVGILLAVYTAGVRKLMLKNNLQVPEYLHAAMPFPASVHRDRDKLRNFMYVFDSNNKFVT